MTESAFHSRLVHELSAWIANHFFAGDFGYLLTDLPSNQSSKKPPLIRGFVPDVYVPCPPATRIVIGEAKTPGDLETRRTRKQLQAFLAECNQHEDAFFVLAVPWYLVGLGRALVNELKIEFRTSSISTTVVDQLPG